MAGPGSERRRPKRRLLGKASGFEMRQRVYATREALEIDEIEDYDITRKRVFYDDVLLVTHHRFHGTAYLIVSGIAAAGATALVLSVARVETGLAVGFLLLAALPLWLVFLLRATLGVDAVTVFGRRSKARLHFPFRKRRAAEVFAQICRSVTQAQARKAGPSGRAPGPALGA